MATMEEIEVFRELAGRSEKSRYKFRLWLFKKYHLNRYGTKKIFEYQKRYLRSEGGKKVLLTGRQVGKSVMNAVECLSQSYLKDYQTIVLLAPTKKQTKELYDKIKEMLSLSDLLYDYVEVDNQSELKFKNGSVIKLITAKATSVRGFTANLVVCDEAAFITDDVYQALDALTLVQGGSIRLISTPGLEKKGRFYDIWSDAETDTTWEKFHVTTYENLAIPPEEIEQMKKRLGSESAIMREMEGRYVDEDTLCLVPFQKIQEIMRIKHRQVPEHDKYDYYMGADLAFSNQGDYTAIVIFGVPKNVCTVDECRDKYDDEKIRMVKLITRKDTQDSFQAAQLILELYNEWRPKRIWIDKNGAGMGVYDNVRYAITNYYVVKPVDLRGAERTDAYMIMADMIQKDCVVFCDDKPWKTTAKIIDHFANVTKSKSKTGTWKVDKNKNGHDDICDAVTFALYGIYQEIGMSNTDMTYMGDIDFSDLWKPKSNMWGI